MENKQFTICPPEKDVATVAAALDIVAGWRDALSARGFWVTDGAIMHNFRAWKDDRKSGYRESGCHLFTPCGCNPFSLSASAIEPGSDWQYTYPETV